MKILFIVCPNGFGHIKRSAEIAKELINIETHIKFKWFLSKQCLRYLTSNCGDRLFNSSTFNTFNDNESISNNNIFNSNFEKLYFYWVKGLQNLINSDVYDLVISDNVCAPLKYHNNVIMIGSFLWHDVIKASKLNEKVLVFEKSLFRNKKPLIFSMKNFTMSEITKNGNNIEFPSISEKYITNKKNKKSNINILLSPGKSGELREDFKRIKNILLKNQLFNVYFDSYIDDNFENDNSHYFDYSDESFDLISLIICRPGIGIISDAIRHQLPLIINDKYDNTEIEFNSKVIEKLGIGKRLALLNENIVNNYLQKLFSDRKELRNMIFNLNKMESGGSKKIASYILKIL